MRPLSEQGLSEHAQVFAIRCCYGSEHVVRRVAELLHGVEERYGAGSAWSSVSKSCPSDVLVRYQPAGRGCDDLHPALGARRLVYIDFASHCDVDAVS